MRRNFNIIIVILVLFSGLSKTWAADYVEVAGTVRDSKNKKALENVSVSIAETNIGTVTNSDGYFLLKIPAESIKNGLLADLIGYQSASFAIPNDEKEMKNLSLKLTPLGKQLKEIVVLGGEPKEIIASALKKIPDNYPENDNLFQGFYRETIKKGNRYISISEAILDVLKKPYKRRVTDGEKVSIHKGRKLMSPKPADTLAVKLMGGPYLPLVLDVVKNGDHLFTEEEIDYFDFKMLPATTINNRIHYTISFTPKVSLSYPLNSGVFYIDSESLTISRVEFELDMKDKTKVTRSILQRKPAGLSFKPQEVSGLVTYKTVNGKSYLNYISSTIRFKCDWKKRLFSSGYTSTAEMVMVDREDEPDKKLKFNDAFGKRKIFSDIVENYWEEDFWKDYNIIEPSESLEKAVDKLKITK